VQLKAARGEIARVDGKVDALDKALRAELREVDERHTRNHEANSARIHVLELEKDAVREEIAAMKPRISTLEKDTQELQSTVGEHDVR
jgi:chromosome segregation ATPase